MSQPNRHQIVYRRGQASKDLASIINQYDVCTVYVEEGEPTKRPLNVNALQHCWYKEISEHTGQSIPEITAYCKLELGLPIVRFDVKSQDETDTADYINWTFEKIDFDDRTYDQKIRIIKKTPVTRLMSPRQHLKFREQMQMEYSPGLELVVR